MVSCWSSMCLSILLSYIHPTAHGGGWVRQRCYVSFLTKASHWDWLTVGQGLPPLQQVKVEVGMFLFLLFLCFHSCSSFSHVPLFHLLYYFFYLSSPFLGEMTKMTHTGWYVNPNTINQISNCPYFCFETINWININWFSHNLVYVLILWRSGFGLLVGKFCQVLTRVTCLPNDSGRVL